MKRLKTNNKGITLVALVITIIILIILAGVSIDLLIGDNGIIKIAKDSKKQQTIAELQEKLELLKGQILIDGMGVDLDRYLDELDNYTEEYQINNIDREEGSDVAYAVLEETYRFQIKDEKNGNVQITYEGIDTDLVLSETSGTFIYPEQKTIKVTNNTSGGALSVSSSNEAIATAEINGNEITIKSGAEIGTAIITVTSAKTQNYAKQTTKYTVTVQKGILNVTANGYTGEVDGIGHGIQVTCEGATIKYGTVNGTYDLDESPTYINSGTYTVYYEVTKEGYNTVNGSENIELVAVYHHHTLGTIGDENNTLQSGGKYADNYQSTQSVGCFTTRNTKNITCGGKAYTNSPDDHDCWIYCNKCNTLVACQDRKWIKNYYGGSNDAWLATFNNWRCSKVISSSTYYTRSCGMIDGQEVVY